MKHFLIITFLILVGLPLVLPVSLFPQSQQEHEKIVEEVSVNWWQVPVFAVDNAGNPVTDLKPEEIEIQLNGSIMPRFTLLKRTFGVTEKKYQTLQTPSAQQLPTLKKKVIFLLFDLVLSGEISTTRAKKIAEKIIMEAEEDTQFYVLTIDALNGLIYIGEGSGKTKDQLNQLIREKVKVKQNSRFVDVGKFIASVHVAEKMGEGRKSKYEDKEEFDFFFEVVSKWYKRKNMGFLYAFETLYFYLNAIRDNKFIYLFSEGMSQALLNSSRSQFGNRGMYNFYFKRIGQNLSRCGAVLFFINTMGVEQYSNTNLTKSLGFSLKNSFSNLSGEDTLHLLTKESGGTYLEGTRQEIVQHIENMYRAYYEISFPDPPQIKGMLRDIHITSKRKGVTILSLKTLEKRKHYTQMNSLEKDMLALNLVTQPPNTLIKSKITVYNVPVEKIKKNKKQTAYTVTLPPSQSYKALDVYKLWISTNHQGSSQVEKIEKENLEPKKNKLKIEFDLKEILKQKDGEEKEEETQSREISTYFVLVNGHIDPPRAYVHGIELYEEDPELLEIQKKELAKQKEKNSQAITPTEMKRILDGAAQYCKKLKQSAFHFYCQEKIVENRQPLSEEQRKNIDISKYGNLYRPSGPQIQSQVYTKVKKALFGYRLIKQGHNIKEEREWLASPDSVKITRDQITSTSAFFSEKAVFAPLTLLDSTRQDKYHFQFIRFAERNGRQAAVIESTPKEQVETATIYGKIWIDMEDFSVMKIEADPRSMRNYQALEDLAKNLRTRLHLSLEIQFDYINQGIRFPTKVAMSEKYKGGRIISRYQGSKGWEHTRTEFTYTDYQFFAVQTDVTVH